MRIRLGIHWKRPHEARDLKPGVRVSDEDAANNFAGILGQSAAGSEMIIEYNAQPVAYECPHGIRHFLEPVPREHSILIDRATCDVASAKP